MTLIGTCTGIFCNKSNVYEDKASDGLEWAIVVSEGRVICKKSLKKKKKKKGPDEYMGRNEIRKIEHRQVISFLPYMLNIILQLMIHL